jgi:hypothetical protein
MSGARIPSSLAHHMPPIWIRRTICTSRPAIRSGRPGFIHVSLSNGRTIVLPDFAGTYPFHVQAFFRHSSNNTVMIKGNRLITSLGNSLPANGTLLAALTIMSFTTSDVVYVTGNARRLIGGEARVIMPQQNALTVFEATGAVLVRNALPIREHAGGVPS